MGFRRIQINTGTNFIPIALVAHTAAIGAPNGQTTSAINTTGATLLIVSISRNAGSTAVVSDSKGNTWTQLTSINGTNNNCVIYYAISNPATVGSGHTFTVTGTGIFSPIAAAAFSGTNAVSPFDVQNGHNAGMSATVQPGSITPSVNNCLIVCAQSNSNPGVSATGTINSGYTLLDYIAFAPGAYYSVGLAYLIQTTATATNPTWTLNATPPENLSAIASFKP